MRTVLLCIACFLLGSWFGFMLTALCVAAGRRNDNERL